MRSEKILLLRHLVAILAISSSASWIYPGVQALLKFIPIKDITLGTEVTIDWQGQPSLGNVQQTVVLMKDGNALMTLCEGQITGSGQCSFELRSEHQVLGDGYQLAMQGKDGVALDYSGVFSIKSAEVKAEEVSWGGEAEGGKKDEDETEIEEESTGYDIEDGDDHDDEDHEEDNNKADEDDDDEEENKKKKDKKHKHKHHNPQKSEDVDEESSEDQRHHHQKVQQQKKKKQQQHNKQQQKEDKHYQKQADKQLKKLLRKHQKQQQQWFAVQSVASPQQRTKEAAQLLEKNRRRRQMMLTATRQKYLRLRREALRLQMSINSVLDQLMPASAQAAKPPTLEKLKAAIMNNIGIQPVLENDAHAESMPDRPIAESAVAGETDEIDFELADEQDPQPDLLSSKQDDGKQKIDKEKRDEEKAEALTERRDKWEETNGKDKDNQEPSSAWDKLWGGIAAFGKTVGATVADGFTKIKQVVIAGGADAPEGEL
ncbi:hypothetical protein BGW39_009300 [Mortierella sp. 14UC]|nr:hypothetical protein BGW39_009300 [Mortierella sp. 14UC]